ncbi:Killer protein [Methylococcaceae bacterium CS5]|nr:Killer protein [Methylococcaceae bacterium CS5]
MIKTFKHKGLKLFFTTGNKAKINASHASKLKVQLQALHTAESVDDMNIPGWSFHELKGDRKDVFSITVSGNWRVTFEFVDGNAFILNYEDYH